MNSETAMLSSRLVCFFFSTRHNAMLVRCQINQINILTLRTRHNVRPLYDCLLSTGFHLCPKHSRWWFRNKYLHKYYEYYTFNHSLQMLTTLTSRKTTTKVFEYWRKTSNLQNIYWWMYFAHRSIASSSEEHGREKSSKKWVTLNISQLQNLL